MWLIKFILLFWCFNVCYALKYCMKDDGITAETCTTKCYRRWDYSFRYQLDGGCASNVDSYDDDQYAFCDEENCNSDEKGAGFAFNKMADKRKAEIQCLKDNVKTESCASKMCSTTIKKNDEYESGGCAMADYNSAGVSNEENGYTYNCYGDSCNVDHKTRRKCHVGQYGDCDWTHRHTTEYGVEEEPCDQWHVQNICVHQIWTHNTNTTRICHKYSCHHTYAKHGYELVYKVSEPLKDTSKIEDTINDDKVVVNQCVTKNESCFTLSNPPAKIQCYSSTGADLGTPQDCKTFVTRCRLTRNKYTGEVSSRDGCSPSNVEYGAAKEDCESQDENLEICDVLGDKSNGVEEGDKDCWTGIEGDCKALFETPIEQIFYHEPEKTYCYGWGKKCYKTEFKSNASTCTWYNCDVWWHENVRINEWSTDKNNNNGTVHTDWNVTHTECEGDDCNIPMNSGNNLTAKLAWYLMLFAIQGWLILG